MIDLKDKTILILGLGASGYAAAEFLLKKNSRVKISENGDSSEIRADIDKLERSGRIEHETGGHTGKFCSKTDMIVASPGVDVRKLYSSGLLPRDIPLIGTLELGANYCRAPIIAVTGTNGKSTVTELTGHILSSSGRDVTVCGNIGNPLIGEIDSLGENSVAVVEVSSFQLETIKKFRPHIAVLLNITADHYDRHNDHEGYKTEKYKIFMNQTDNDWAVINSNLKNDPEIKDIKSHTIFFGEDGDMAKVSGNEIVLSDREKEGTFSIGEEVLPVSGGHNLENVACSALVAGLMGIDKSVTREAITTFKPLKHRTENIGCFGGIEFIDDSKATNIDATRRAVETVNKKLVLIVGGRDKGGDYSSLLPLVKEKVKTMIVLGEAKKKIANVFDRIVPVIETDDMGFAVKKAVEKAEYGDVVMLSPMCSSFDMFSGYKERGEAFQREVKKQVS